MDVIYLCIISILLIACAVLLWLLAGKARQNRRFAEELRALRTRHYISPLRVERFSRDVVELACEINEMLAVQKRLEAEYVRSEEKLKRMIAGISHDFRTPLTAIQGYLQLLERSGHLSAADQESLMTALERCRYLVQLSEDFFALSRLQAEEHERINGRENLTELLIQCCMAQYDQMEQRGLKFLPDIPEKPLYASGEAHSMERVLQNLFANACRYARTTVKVSLTATSQHLTLHFENDVADTELEEGECQQVFEPFYRGAVRHGSGSGLGLYTVKSLTERMGGKVCARMSGDCFHVEVTFLRSE